MLRRAAGWIAAFSLLAGGASAARAQVDVGQPKTRIVAACTAKPPEAGQVFRGAVLEVLDGRTLCVAQGPDPSSWVQVSIAAIPLESSRGALMAATFAKPIACVADRTAEQGTVAHCVVEDRPVSALVLQGDVIKASLDWR